VDPPGRPGGRRGGFRQERFFEAPALVAGLDDLAVVRAAPFVRSSGFWFSRTIAVAGPASSTGEPTRIAALSSTGSGERLIAEGHDRQAAGFEPNRREA